MQNEGTSMGVMRFNAMICFAMLSWQCHANDLHTQIKNTKKNDAHFMQLAIQLAKNNPKAPFAALIVNNKSGKILAQGLNASNKNPTFHGEMVAINNFAKLHPPMDWSGVTLYTTAEPCPMCQSAIIWAGIPRVVYGTSIHYLKTHGWSQIDISSEQINKNSAFYNGTITGGVLAKETNPLFNIQNN